MAAPDSGGLNLDSSQETFEGTLPYSGVVTPPVPGLVQWAYSLVVEGMDHSVAFSVTLLNSKGEKVTSDQAVEGIASIEGALAEQTYELRIDGARPISFRAIRTQTYGYRQ
jgi:hypothetical protein